MIKEHKFEKDILTLKFTKFDVEIDTKKGYLTFHAKDKQKELNWPGEYEIEDVQITIIPSTEPDLNFINIFDDRSILILPNNGKYSKLLTEDILNKFPETDILIMINKDDIEDEKKILQMIEPRISIKIGGTPREKDEILETISSKDLIFSEDKTNRYCTKE